MASNHEIEELKKLVNKVQDFAEKHKYAYLVPEQMLYVLLSDEKCVNLIKKLTTDKNKAKAISELKKEVGDQKRVATPADAVRDGATHLVVGRPILAAEDPVAAAKAIRAEMNI